MFRSNLNRVGGAARLSLSLAAVAVALAFPAQAAQWQPNKPVEIVVPAGAGGASDQMARLIQGIIIKHKLMKPPMIVQIKGGSSGAEGIMDVKASAGNPHKLLIALSSLYTLPLATNLPFNWKDLTPVAMIAMDEFLLWVNSETPYKTPKEFLEAAKKANGDFKMGGTGSKREDHIISVALDKAAGARFAYIPYKSGGEAATQLVGKHTDANVNNPSENVAQWRAGQVRALCVFAEQRMAHKAKVAGDLAWSDIPTCKESGVDFQYQMLRAILLPPGVTADQVAFYADLMKKVTATPEWKQYMEKNALKEVFLTGKDFVQFMERDEATHRKLMAEAGFLAK